MFAIPKRKIGLFAGGALALREMQCIAYALLSRNAMPEIFLYGPSAEELFARTDFALKHVARPMRNLQISPAELSGAVVTDVIALPNASIKKYTIPHGSLPANYSVAVSRGADICFCLSQEHKSFLQEKNPGQEKPAYVVAGCASVDDLLKITDHPFTESVPQKNSRTKKHHHEKKRIVLSTHWSNSGLFHLYGNAVLTRLREVAPNCNLILTGHPKLFDLTPKERNFSRESLTSFLAHAQSLDITVHIDNSRVLLPHADVVIGDISSLMAEASLFNLDIICDQRHAIPASGTQSAFENMIHSFNDLDQLQEKVRFALSNPLTKNRQRVAFARRAFPNLGKATSVIADSLLQNLT